MHQMKTAVAVACKAPSEAHLHTRHVTEVCPCSTATNTCIPSRPASAGACQRRMGAAETSCSTSSPWTLRSDRLLRWRCSIPGCNTDTRPRPYSSASRPALLMWVPALWRRGTLEPMPTSGAFLLAFCITHLEFDHWYP